MSERRWQVCEVRSDEKVLTGCAVRYGDWSDLLFETFKERILPGAFADSLKSGRDIFCTIDHDPKRVLGRQSARTLSLRDDKKEMEVEVPFPPYTYAQDLVVAIKRGDLRGMSFIFDVIDDQWETRDGTPHRTVKKADIYEVSFVFFPAYPTTEAGVRMAFPVDDEERAIAAARALSLEPYRRRLELAEKEW